jgi:D-threo-aldose 1-dehydrogenase
MGCSALGNLYRAMSDAEAHSTIDAALTAGVRYFDTAPLYGFGLSERRLGAALTACASSDVVISSKVGRVLIPTAAGGPREGFVDALPFAPVFDYSFQGVMSSHEATLGRLHRSRVNILLAHDLGAGTHGNNSARMTQMFLGDGYRAMQELRSTGQIDAIGIGVNETEICEELLDAIELDVILLAGRYTLLEQGALPLLERCARLGVQVIIGGPFNSGLLVEPEESRDLHYNYGTAPPEIIARVRALRAICARFDVPLPAAALRFPAAHPAVSCVLPGLASEQQIRQTLEWRDQSIPPQLWLALREAGLLAPAAPFPGAVFLD